MRNHIKERSRTLELLTMAGGSMCSKSGRLYELAVQKACSTVASPLLKIPLNTQSASELGGCDYTRPDLVLNWAAERDVAVEIKRNHAPDWIQTALVVGADGAWSPKVSKRNRDVVHIVRDILEGAEMYPDAPPFLQGDMTIHEWDAVKHAYGDMYLPCDSMTIANAYHEKKVHYIQVEGHGLYHTREDFCDFGTTVFTCTQRLRIRMKKHGKRCKLTGKHVPSSVTASFRPVFKSLRKSPVSLDSSSCVAAMIERTRERLLKGDNAFKGMNE
jgi:hypothetical protein